MNETNERYQRILNGAAHWGAFYRKHPEQFAEDYLHIKLKLFQKILLVMMMWSTTFVMIACRGIGKTYLSAIYCVTRCILYPGTKICIASGTRGQAIAVLEKITLELKPQSAELRSEINEKESKMNGTNAILVFNNTSSIKVVTASDSSRGNRANVLLLDEFRLISKNTIDTILSKFLTLRRMPRYSLLSDEEKKKEYAKEKNLTIYLSSAYWKDHWAFKKCLDVLRAMINPSRHQFVCGFPYQLSIKEGLLDPEVVEDDMADSSSSDIRFSMEMCAEFYGSAEGAFFDFDSISRTRRIKYPLLPDELSSKVNNSKFVRIPQKQPGELRILSADIALMSSRKRDNDASAIFINQLIKTKAGRYTSNIVFADSSEGLRTDEQALEIRRYFDEYDCDYLVLDTSGLGIGIYDAIARDMPDPETGEVYPALSCYNNQEMAERCTVPGAPKVIWAIKASAQFNSECAFSLRQGFKSGRLRLLETEYDAEESLKQIHGYKSLSPAMKNRFMLPYVHTTLLVDELTKLQFEESGGKVKMYERAGMRKDRYSSLSYNYWVAIQLENKMTKKYNMNSSYSDVFIIKPPSYKGKAVNNRRDRRDRSRDQGWL